MTEMVIDTSVAVPLLVRTHEMWEPMRTWTNGRVLALCGHAVAETYSVLTRLPGDIRLEPGDAARLIEERFATPVLPKAATMRSLPGRLARLGITGGAVYDALVGLAAADHGVVLATRDVRARSTYTAVGAQVILAR